MKRLMCALVAAASMVLVLSSCGDEAVGSPPVISDLSYQPNTGTAGSQVTITGSLVFEDSDADANRFAAEVRGPGDLQSSVPAAQAQGVTGLTSGTLVFTLVVVPPVAGAYEFDIWMLDAEDNASNRLTGTLTIE